MVIMHDLRAPAWAFDVCYPSTYASKNKVKVKKVIRILKRGAESDESKTEHQDVISRQHSMLTKMRVQLHKSRLNLYNWKTVYLDKYIYK